MSIPTTLLNVSFNAMFAEVIPGEHRAYLVGGRNAILAITSLLFTLGSGKLLVMLPQPLGYQVVFGIGFIGSMVSSLHLFFIRNISPSPAGSQAVSAPPVRGISKPRIKLAEWAAALDRRYLKVVLLLFCFHVAQWLVIPVVPLLAVHQLQLSDFQISLGSSLFSLVNFLVSFQVARIINRSGNRKAAGFGMVGIGIFPLILSLAGDVTLYLVANLVGAISWSVLAVALLNYLLENTPEHDRSVYMSYYIVANNAAILIGSLLGPYISSMIGYSPALGIFALLRVLTGVLVLLLG